MSVGMSQSHFRDPASTEVCDIFLTMVTDTSLRRWILATTVMMGIVRATSCSSFERSSPFWSGDLLQMVFATVLRVRVFPRYMAVDALIHVSAPGPFGDRGIRPSWFHGADGLVHSLHRRLLARIQSGPLIVLLTSHHHVLSQGGF